MVTSRDGTRLPLFLAHRKGVPRDGSRPALLTGYGGFDVNMLPGWTPAAIPFLESGGTGLRAGGAARWRRVRRGLASGGHAGQQAERLRRFHRGRELAGRRAGDQSRAVGDLGRLERWLAGRRGAHPAARSVSRGGLRGAAAGHAPLPPVSHRRALDSRVRLARRSRGAPLAGGLLALCARSGRREISRRVSPHRRLRFARRSHARPQDDGPVAGHDRRDDPRRSPPRAGRRRGPTRPDPPARSCCRSRATPATAPASRSPR